MARTRTVKAEVKSLLAKIVRKQKQLARMRDEFRSLISDAVEVLESFDDADAGLTTAIDELERSVDKMSELV